MSLPSFSHHLAYIVKGWFEHGWGEGKRVGVVVEQVSSTLAFSRFGRTLLLVESAKNPTRQDWSLWVESYARALAEYGTNSLLVVTDGGGPNAAQRRELVDALTRSGGPDFAEHFRTAICADAPIARFITAALDWLIASGGMKMFGAEQYRKGLRYLGVEDAEQDAIVDALGRLQSKLRSLR